MSSNVVAYSALGVLNAILTQFAIELGAGHVPIPPEWRWVVPILSAGIVALTALLPRVSQPPAQTVIQAGRVERIETNAEDKPA